MKLIVSDAARNRAPVNDAELSESISSQVLDSTLMLCPCGRMFRQYRSFQRYCCDAHRMKYGKSKAPSKYVRKPVKEQACKNCGEVFKTNDAKRHYCSDACYHAYQLKRRAPIEKRTCFKCGKEFETTHWAKRYCSEECRRSAREVS